MIRLIRYYEVDSLPIYHPKFLAFVAEQDALDKALEAAGPTATIHDEETMEHFDRFIAEDRK